MATREATIHEFLAERDYPTPAVLLRGAPDDELGGAWLLTEHVPTSSAGGAWRTVSRWPPRLRELWRRPSLLADLTATLHSIDPDPLRAALEAEGDSFDWYSYQWHMVELLQSTGRDEVIDWLRTNRPFDSQDVVSHGDLHPGNIVPGLGGPSVVDWGIGGIAPAARDVACTMFSLLNTGSNAPGPARPVFRILGRFLSRRYTRLYRRSSPASMTDEELDWHRVLYSMNRILWASLHEANPVDSNGQGGHSWGVDERIGSSERELPIHCRAIKTITGLDIA